MKQVQDFQWKFLPLITSLLPLSVFQLSERLHQGKGQEPEWLLSLRQLLTDKVFKLEDTERGLMAGDLLALQFPLVEHRITPKGILESSICTKTILSV